MNMKRKKMSVRVGVFLAVGWVPVYGQDFLRDLAADRPDATESPVTVEKGSWQIESSLWSYATDKEAGLRAESWVWGETNLKLGLTDRSDLQLVLQPWVHSTEKIGGVKTTAEGFGDVQLRLKVNLWGNDGETTTGLALLPYVQIPSGTDVSVDEWEGGFFVPFGMDLGGRWGLGLQAGLERLWEDEGSDHQWVFSHTAVLGCDLGCGWGAFVEYIGEVGEVGDYEISGSAGVTLATSGNLQWDLATTFGITDGAEDFGLFQGVTFRF
jgi:hypothetical protein